MPRSDDEIERLAVDTERWLDEVDPATLDPEDTSDLMRVALAADAVTDAEKRLREAVEEARDNDRSWGRIGTALGVSRQAALKRFGTPTTSDR